MNIFTVKYNADGSIEQSSDMRVFKLSNGATIIEGLCHLDSNLFDAYINFELPTMEQIASRAMIPAGANADGYFVYNYLLQSDELRYRGKLLFSITFEEKKHEI